MRIFVLMFAALVMMAAPAWAEQNRGRGGPPKVNAPPMSPAYRQDDAGRVIGGIVDAVAVLIGAEDRTIISDYMRQDYRRHCPPGLAKKRNGCRPPGLSGKYKPGHPLGSDVMSYPLPPELLGRIKPAPRGYQYVQVDKDVLLISEATKKVVDAVTLLSAVGD